MYVHPAGQAGLFRSILPFFSLQEYPGLLMNLLGGSNGSPFC